MQVKSLVRLALIAAAATSLSACYDGYYGGGGVGYASTYSGYGGPVGYGGDYYGGFGYPGYGYYNDVYYPGYGVYVFDRGGHRREWREDERRHWDHGGDFRGGRLAQNGRVDVARDHGYMRDRQASFQNYQRESRGGGQGWGGQGRGGGGQSQGHGGGGQGHDNGDHHGH